ncbi:hypothetical protein AB3Z07_13825 [Metabacillus halosaccharovorans]|uniref:hypothetical protein n=1 Tax=Metabacillus halosaccharovorans TaxID=930124 RepID=UPI0034CECB87
MNNVNAQSAGNSSDNIMIDESLLNGSDPFTSIKEINNDSSVQNDDSDITTLASYYNVSIDKLFSGITGSWRYTGTSTITRVYINMKLNYRENWLDSWDTYDSELFSYSGGLGLQEENEKTWYPTKKGQYRVCASGTITRVTGSVAVTGCSGTVSHDGGIIISREKEL